ncbi:hypothetical protein [Nonomuraea sp. NPDC049504]
MNFVILAGLRLMYARLDTEPLGAAVATDDHQVAADEPQQCMTARAA